MNFHPNLAIFCQKCSRIRGKMTNGVTVLAQNPCVCGYRPVLHYFEVNISVLERFMKSGMGIMDTFLLQIHHLLQSKSILLRKTDKFCCCSGSKHMCVWFQTVTMPLGLQYQFIRKVHEDWERNQRQVCSPTLPYYIEANPYFGEKMVSWGSLTKTLPRSTE